jgi:hypothetical protein
MSKSASRLWPVVALALVALALYFALRRPAAPPPPAAPAAPTPNVSTPAPRPAESALTQSLTVPDPRERARAFGTEFQDLLARDPEAALAYLRVMPFGPQRTQALLATLDVIARTAPDRALSLARELVATRDDLAVFNLLFDRFARESIPATQTRLATVPAGEARTNALRAFLDVWARADTSAALAWAQALTVPADREPALETALYNLLTKDPLQAIELAQKNLTGPALERIVLTSLQTLTATDPQGAASLVARLPPGETQVFAAVDVARALGANDPAAAVAWLNTLPPGKTHRTALANILTEWDRRDAAAAQAYVATLAAGPNLDAAAAHYGALFGTREPIRALAWAQSLSTNSARQAALISAANAWAQSEPAAATQWAANQSAAPLPALTGAFSYWLLHDAPAARAWLTTSPLPAEVKSKLQPK